MNRVLIPVVTVVLAVSGCALLPQAREKDNVATARAWLAQLARQDTVLSEVTGCMSSEFNFDGTLDSGEKAIRDRVQEMRNVLTSSAVSVEFTDFRCLTKREAENLMTNSGHRKKYALTAARTHSMVLFSLRATLKPTGGTNVDGVYLGFDSAGRMISWFD